MSDLSRTEHALLNWLLAARPATSVLGWRADTGVTWREFLVEVQAWHTLLAHTPGQNFALFYHDSMAFASALLGAWQAGKAIYLPADTLAATCEGLRDAVDGYLGEFPSAQNPLNLSTEMLQAAASAAPSNPAFQTLAPDFPALVVYTSGSTGAAQAIPKKLSQLAAEVATLEQLFGAQLQQADIVATVSHQHIYGLLFKVLWPLTMGRAIHAHSYSFPEALAETMAMRACVLISSPAHLKRLPQLNAWKGAANNLRAVFSSGGPLLRDDAQAAAELLGQMPIEVFGSSESGGIAWRQRTAHADECWTPLPGVSCRIASEGDVLEVRSPHLPDTGWLRLSDRAQAEKDGRFALHGRVDRIVKIEEKRISLDAIEQALMASPLVEQARALLVDGATPRQRIAALIILTVQGRARLAELGKLGCNRVLSDALSKSVLAVALPRSWRYLDAFPINAQGKTTHAEMLAILDDAALRPILPQQRLLEQDAQRVVYELIAPRDLVYFDGHFPGLPILAGVVQIEWAMRLARANFDVPPHFRGIHVLKFQRVIRPDTPFMLTLQHDPAKSVVAFNLHSESGQHASGRLLFGADDV